MKKMFTTAVLTAAFALTMSATAFAGQWQQNSTGWWWQEDDGSYPQDTWRWLDGNNDGLAECYYFDSNGYMLAGTSVNGYQLDSNGRWVQDGAVQYQQASAPENAAMAALRAATEKSKSMTAIDTDMLMNMQISMEGLTLDMNMNGNMKMKDIYSDSMEYLMDMNLNLLGETVHMNYFYTGGYGYYDIDGEKMKIPMDMATAMESAQTASLVTEDDLSYIQDASMTDNGNGTYTIYFTANGAKLNQMVQSVFGTMGSEYADLGSSVSFDTYKGEMTLDTAGNSIQEKALMDMTVNYEGSSMTYHMYVECNINNPGQPVNFTLPSTDGYPDITQTQVQ
ncbi:MAG TPA: hypothetical protein IAA04_01185 [Candidatus Lachnoclostridium pullistercoris]|uniref:Uncharacterized protein n=1 Tax=Candidatus Lachnoclostridium pullistercoris TaxID=2838632 RepID=A0A9D2PB08_9FIRM|nr:hypothetical protein [Candidatus Lachnoclostridium pullistercoris]